MSREEFVNAIVSLALSRGLYTEATIEFAEEAWVRGQRSKVAHAAAVHGDDVKAVVRAYDEEQVRG